MKVPHELIVKVNAELELEEKCRRLAHRIYGRPVSHNATATLVAGLKLAFAAQYGRSNLLAWRITNEWNDITALIQLERLLIGNTGNLIERTRLRHWERNPNPNPNPKPKIKSETDTNFAY